MNRHRTALAALTTAAALVTTGPAWAQGAASAPATESDPCNVIAGMAIGVIGGLLFGGRDRARAAAIGGAAGAMACIAVNAASRRTRTAQQVEEDYKTAHAGELPQGAPVLQTYDVRVNPTTDVKSGESFQIVSNITVISSAQQPVSEVREAITLTGPDGKTRNAEKVATEQSGSGAFENTFTLTLPSGVASGSYPVTTKLSINGQVAGERQQTLQIMAASNGGLLLALADR